MGNREIQYSIIRHLSEKTDTNEVYWQRDGLSIDSAPKPFIVVWGIQENIDDIAAGRNDYEEVYHYQITVRENTEDELQILRREVIAALREPVALYDLGEESFTTNRFFYVDIDSVESMPSEDVSREVDYHRLHIDATVETFFDVDTDTFTQ